MLSLLTLPLVVAGQQIPDPKLRIYQHWNECVESLKDEGDFESGLWPRLLQSLRDDPPEHVKSLDRIAIYDELIILHEKRIAALKKMRELEKK
ncbi:MAG: hypothetical protein WBV94_02710 [Blastocatellia bacterium]